MISTAKYFQISGLTLLALPQVGNAHPWHWPDETVGFLNGLIHPLESSDHILTMLAVGLWLARYSRLGSCFMAMFFVALMLLGGSLGFVSIEIIHAEIAMYLSVLVLSVMLVLERKVSLPVGVILVGSVAVFHGYEHAYDMWLDIDAIAYTAGFALATVSLLAIGIATSWLFVSLKDKYSLAIFRAER
ncbi:HupE-UreJ family metal transporter [Methylomonas albis]|uniref:HupE/UreJ family protein n=1 Tax=Methylomonas albis TaxID=1854563 RepID=A0ABR9D4F6_9GAMM|nr:HupE/UreJ family protein [Methylomonas albis]MBD9357666.1 HupE/UreJ family protein [Methylomonas albis]CAD6880978.1 HupE-UreJ family metal transporter [Methylomonas albis]